MTATHEPNNSTGTGHSGSAPKGVGASPVGRANPRSHPLGPLTAEEITQSAGLVRACWPSSIECHFKVITLREPPKTELAPYLAAERAGQAPGYIDRRAFVVYYFRGTVSRQSWRVLVSAR